MSPENLKECVCAKRLYVNKRTAPCTTPVPILNTAKRQNRNPIETFKSVLLFGPDTPTSVLYNPRAIPLWDSS